MAEQMDPHRIHMAVLSGEPGQESGPGRGFEIAHPVFYGTAFAVAADLFLTAAHVYNGAGADGEVVLARLTKEGTLAQRVVDVELFEDVDLALLVCPYLEAECLPFDFRSLFYLDEVEAMGFPFSLDPETLVFHLRAFKGHVVTRRGLTQLPGAPPGYEVSFVPPRGLSGAPLVCRRDGVPYVSGIVLQHYTNEFGEVTTQLGIAVDAEELLTLTSRWRATPTPIVKS
jgi:hypothetical protein